MSILIVVNNPKDWPLAMEGVEVVAARSYLSEKRYGQMQRARVFNLCRSYRYQATGYYVSLLAEARGHKPLPDIATIQDLKSQPDIRIVSGEIDEIIQKSLHPLKSAEFVLSVYFGQNVAKRYETLSQQLFNLFQAPLLRAFFVHHDKEDRWLLKSIHPIAAREIPGDHYDFVVEAARAFFARRQPLIRRRSRYRYDLAILHDPHEKEAPSNTRALKKIIKAAESVGFETELIHKDDYGRLAEFDALFIRETTNVNHHTYRFARRAAILGLVVVDDPLSILKCTNKVFLAELLEKNHIRIPRTRIVDRESRRQVVEEVGLPCILKQPDSSFSQGVVKVETKEEMQRELCRLLERSDLVIAQEFLPTAFDWRVGIFDGYPLFVCKYFMAEKHWQIIRRDSPDAKPEYGYFETLPVEFAPKELIKLAVRAARLIGNGLYGLDIKQKGNRYYVIEINDNPNLDAGVEDAVLKDELYLRIARVFMRRVEQAKSGGR